MRGTTSVVQEDDGHSVAGSTASSGSDLFAHAGFEQLLQNATVSVRMRSTDSERLSGSLSHILKTNSTSVTVGKRAKKDLEVAAESYDLRLLLTDYKVSKDNLERKI